MKRYIVRKYIMANTALEAINKERKMSPDDVWIDPDWQKDQKEYESYPPIKGFQYEKSKKDKGKYA